MIIVGLEGAVYEAPQANAWVVEDGVLSVVAVNDDGITTNEYGVFAAWDYVCDNKDVKLQMPIMPATYPDSSGF